jgi:hypothetical protein
MPRASRQFTPRSIIRARATSTLHRKPCKPSTNVTMHYCCRWRCNYCSSTLLAACLAKHPCPTQSLYTEPCRSRSLHTTRPSRSCPAGRPISAQLRMRAALRPGDMPPARGRFAARPGPHGPGPISLSWRPGGSGCAWAVRTLRSLLAAASPWTSATRCAGPVAPPAKAGSRDSVLGDRAGT